MKVGFTGTRWGMTDAQKVAFSEVLTGLLGEEGGVFLHGDCQGADDEAADEVAAMRSLSFMERSSRSATEPGALKIVAHPGPDNDPYRAHNPRADKTLPGKGHFARNRDIVDGCDVLVACPREIERQERGGTWYTIDYAIKKGRRTVIIYPDGTTKDTRAET